MTTFNHGDPVSKVEQFCQSQAPTRVVERRIAEVSFGNCETEVRKAWADLLMLMKQRAVSREEIADLADTIRSDVLREVKPEIARWLEKRAYVLRMVLHWEIGITATGERHRLTIKDRARQAKVDHGALADLEREVVAIFECRIQEAAAALGRA